MTQLLASMWMPDAATMRLVTPELVLIGTIVAILLAPLIGGKSTRTTAVLALLGCVICAIASWLNLNTVAITGGSELFGVVADDGSVAAGMLVVDRLSSFFRLFLMIFLAAIIGMWLMFDADREENAPEFFTLLLTSALGMALMAGTSNLLMMIIAIEMASLPSYALAGFDKHRRIASEASVKYVIFGAVTSGFMIYGTSLLFGMFGTLHVPTLVANLADSGVSGPLLAVALLALFAGIGFKISAVPFHFWCPDVFEGASLSVTTWLSVASKAAGLVLLLRLVFTFAGPGAADPAYTDGVLTIISYGVGFFAILTCSFANLAAYRQTNIRRMLAYSSIAHAGYMLMAGAVVLRMDGYASAMSAVVAYLLMYLFMNLGAFLSLGLVAADTGSEDIKSFSGVGWRDPLVAASLTVCLISLVGLPPAGGFFVKWWLLTSLASAAEQWPFMWWLVVALALNTAVSLYYYARVVWQMYFVQAEGGPLRAPMIGKATVAACAVILILTGTVWVSALKFRADAFSAQIFTPAVVRSVASEPTPSVALNIGESP